MEFEYDPAKSESNQAKHGVDFEAAKDLWADPQCLVVQARSVDEGRFAIIGELRERIWTCIFTVREERVRIISLRRARDEEEERYHQC